MRNMPGLIVLVLWKKEKNAATFKFLPHSTPKRIAFFEDLLGIMGVTAYG